MPQNKIIKVKPIDNWFIITWELSNRCNQSCCYCPDVLHSFNGKSCTLEELQQHWKDIFYKTKHTGLKYKISFTGGEVSTQKNFLPFLEWLRENYGEHLGQLLVTTNGSASADYYLKMYKLVDNISFSVHSEFIDEIKFFSNLIKLKENLLAGKFLHVNLMDEPWNKERIKYYEEILKDNDIFYSVNSIWFLAEASKPMFKGNLNFDLSKSYKLQLRNNT